MTYEPENMGYQSIQSVCTGIVPLFVKARGPIRVLIGSDGDKIRE